MIRLQIHRFHALLQACLITAVLFLLPGRTAAQIEPFSRLTLSASTVVNVHRGEFYDYWRSGPGAFLELSTPFYLGAIKIGVNFMPYEGREDELLDFTSGYSYLGWGLERDIWGDFRGTAGLLAGSFRFNFDDAESEKYRQSEAELCAGLSAGLKWQFLQSWSVDGRADYLRIFTAKPIDLLYLSIGCSRSFNTPDWLLELLR